MDFLNTLNPQQQQAVTAEPGVVLVLAGPGSGKTRVLTQRIAYLIVSAGARPHQMLAVTFTNKAAREMEGRIKQLLGEESTRGLWLGTFHATCARLLRAEAEHLPIGANFVIYDEDDQLRLVKSCIRELNLDDKTHRPASVHAAISRAKNELILAVDYPIQTYRDEVVKRVYAAYQNHLAQSNAVDFDDLLLQTAFLLEENLAMREKYARKFHHVLVDEFQDTNQAQYVLLRQLASVHRNLFCVGDEDQSVYRWRGADYRNIKRLETDFPESRVLLLEQNYRSRQYILDAAMAVINRAQHRYRKELFTERGRGEKVIFYEAFDDYGEASFVVDTIAQLVASKKFEPGECAVMYRTNAQSRLLEEAFLQARLPYRLVGAQRFYGRREVKDLIAYLRLVHNPADEVSLDRIINVPPRGIGEKTILSLHMIARQAQVPPGTILLDLANGTSSPFWEKISGRASLPLADFGSLLANWQAVTSTWTVMELFDRIIKDTGYQEYIDDGTEEGGERWENLLEMRRLTTEYDTRTLTDFLQDIALISDQDTLTEGQNAPTLLTLHAAKGLEFSVVFIVGLDDGLLPHSRSFDEPEQMEEERRLFYVGITRAKDQLFLVRSMQRGGRGYSDETIPSRFLDDIPQDLLSGNSRSARDHRHSSDLHSWHAASAAQPVQTLQARFRPGMRVKHPVWGDGMVLNSRIQDDEEIVDVMFESVGIKRLAAALANLVAEDQG